MISHNIALLQKIFPNCVTESIDEKGLLTDELKDNIMKAYKEAIDLRYRFFSFGDAMFIR